MKTFRQIFWWDGMKKDIAYFVAYCDIWNKVKAKHQKPAGLLQPLPISQWEWNDVYMDFIKRLPKTRRGNDAIWVIVDTLTKVDHFIPIITTYRVDELAQQYVSRIVSLHGVPQTITSERGSLFTFAFWSRLHQALGTTLKYSTAYHPQTDGQKERVNQILEDMLRACALAQGPKWEDYLPYAEFSYNNSFQTSLNMSSYEALYVRKCRTPLNWSQTGDSHIFETDLMMEAEKQVKEIRDRLKLAKSRQKSYYDAKHRQNSFEPGENVYLRVTPMKGIKRFQTRGKLAPRFIGPFLVMSRVGTVAYQLELPPELSDVHNMFHVSQLTRCISPPEKNTDDSNRVGKGFSIQREAG